MKKSDKIWITLSYAETANNLQIILTIGLLPTNWTRFIFLLGKKTDWQIASTSPLALSI